MRKDDRVRLRHMLDAAEEAIGFAQGRKRSDLNHDRQFTLAMVKDIEITWRGSLSNVRRDKSKTAGYSLGRHHSDAPSPGTCLL